MTVPYASWAIPKREVSTIALGVGYNIPRISLAVDVVMGGENTEADSAFDDTEYVLDSATLGGKQRADHPRPSGLGRARHGRLRQLAAHIRYGSPSSVDSR